MTERYHPAHQPAPNPQTPYTRREAAAYLGISEAFLKKLDLQGRGPEAIRIGRRWSYLQRDLDAFRELHRHDPAANDGEQQEVA